MWADQWGPVVGGYSRGEEPDHHTAYYTAGLHAAVQSKPLYMCIDPATFKALYYGFIFTF